MYSITISQYSELVCRCNKNFWPRRTRSFPGNGLLERRTSRVEGLVRGWLFRRPLSDFPLHSFGDQGLSQKGVELCIACSRRKCFEQLFFRLLLQFCNSETRHFGAGV